VIIDEVGIGSLFQQGLEGVPDPAWHKDCGLRTHLRREAAAEAFSSTEVNPGAKDSPCCQ
jgi:hypothetical protein